MFLTRCSTTLLFFNENAKAEQARELQLGAMTLTVPGAWTNLDHGPGDLIKGSPQLQKGA